MESDFIIGTSLEDYTHMCLEHAPDYSVDNKVIPNIRLVKGDEAHVQRFCKSDKNG
ncbi:hypothetical protein HpSIM50_15420 [Helicobacter pylori]